MANSIQVDQQLIRSLLQNFDWETNPKCLSDLLEIQKSITNYWLNHKRKKID